jgi:peptidoglycan/LPS O-acetylase OafA/YrhL
MQRIKFVGERGFADAQRTEHAVRSAFRYDINGLRAWAVLPVVLFHFGIPGFSGGFVGVDVFFVISGFLMTGIVVSALERDRFSLLDFYLSRAVRIVPALLALCAVLLAVGWFWLVSIEYRTLSLNVVSALTFVSNVQFWRGSGYFDTASHEKWLLHTWSLSVEWQFYLLLPLAAAFAWRWRRRAGVCALLAVVCVASLACSVYASGRWPAAAFYLLPSRAWELLVGGMVWLFTGRRQLPAALAGALEGVGLALIALAVVRFDSGLRWPGGFAIVPVLGAALVIAVSRQRSPFTGNSVAQWLGTRSYSLYLWHWPVAVLLVYSDRQHDPVSVASGIAAALLLGEASYQFVERPSRGHLSRFAKPVRLLCLGAALGGLDARCGCRPVSARAEPGAAAMGHGRRRATRLQPGARPVPTHIRRHIARVPVRQWSAAGGCTRRQPRGRNGERRPASIVRRRGHGVELLGLPDAVWRARGSWLARC